MRRYEIRTFGFLIALALPAGAFAQDGASPTPPTGDATSPATGSALGAVADAQVTGERARLDAAIRQIKDEDFAGASVVLYELSNDPAAVAFKDDAQYHLAKALYRLGLHHSALVFFAEILSRGSSGRFYKSSLEWCLFIARKIDADDEVLKVVAKYTDGTFSESYKNEFRYELARYHYSRGLALELSDKQKVQAAEARVERGSEGGLSVKGDLFGDDEGDDEGEDETPDEATPAEKKTFDIFGDDPQTEKPAPPKVAPAPPEPEKQTNGEKKKKKKTKKKKKKKAKKTSEGGLAFDDPFGGSPPPKKETPPAPPPVAEAPKPAEPAPKTELEEAKKHLDLANRFVRMVEPSSPFAARAKFLEGVLLYKAGREADAVGSFQTVLRLTKGSDSEEDQQLRQLAFFQLARTHFGAKQPDKSIFYYDRIQRLTYEWLEALYEGSWAQFRLGRYERSLGNLLTLHSPFFKDEYFPESFILKAVSYYENCRYVETNEILKSFLEDYEPVLATLKQLTEDTDGSYYDVLNKLRGEAEQQGGGQAAIVSKIVALAMSDSELKKLDAAFREIDTEVGSFDSQASGFGSSGLRSHLDQLVGESRAELARAAGDAVRRRLEEERDSIRELVDEAVRIQIETSAAEQARIEAKLREVDQRPAEKSNEYTGWTDDERLVWPFENEYWRDELGTYELTLAHTCQ